MVVHGTIRIELARSDSHSFATNVELGNSTFVATIFSNLLTAAGAVSRFLRLRLLRKIRINAKSCAQPQIVLPGVLTLREGEAPAELNSSGAFG